MATGFVWDERFAWHNGADMSANYPPSAMFEPAASWESPDTKRRIRNLLDAGGLLKSLVQIAPRPATDEQILRVHSPEYLDKLRAADAAPYGEVGPRTRAGPRTAEIAILAAGGAVAAVDAVLDGRVRNAYALIRPPGHHAERDTGMGFCYLCNGAIAGRHALDSRRLERIAFVDWDVHHGNGTQRAFWRDPRALAISLHQDGLFPANSGGIDEIGDGDGRGATINIPLPPGSGHGAYLHAFDRVVLPALRRFAPQLIVVSSGFDAGNHDPLGRMMLHSGSYRAMTAELMRVADACCDGRIVMTHEGGYAAVSVPYLALATIEQMSGVQSGVVDPFLAGWAALPGQILQSNQIVPVQFVEDRFRAMGRL